MTALLFAAALTASSAFSPPNPNATADAQAAACAPLMDQTVAPDGTPFRKLNELPPGVYEHAVWRIVQGCPVREVIYKGQAYYVGPSIPRLERGPATGSRMARRNYGPAPDATPNADSQKERP